MTKTWVVVADATVARVFSAVSPVAPLTPETEIANEESVPELADRAGRSFSRVGGHRHAVEPRVDPKEQGMLVFAKKVAGRLAEARAKGQFANLVLVATPHVLGLLRGELDGPTAKLLSREVAKDLIKFDAAQLRDALA